MRKILVAVTMVCTLGFAAEARSDLSKVSQVENGLFSIVVADKIRRECSSISGRLIKAHSRMKSLHSFAKGLGYTDAEIEAYVKADEEKARMRAKRDKYLATQGVVKSDPATYCAAGYAEIDKSSHIGALLKAR